MLASPAYAVGSAGIETNIYSTRTAARANAAVADPREASTIAFNPAGMTEVTPREVVFGSTFIATDFDYDGRAEGRGQESASRNIAPIPHFYMTTDTPIEDLYLGIGANAPFGLVARYSSVGAFQYIAHFNEVKSMAYTVSAAYKVNDAFSIGAGWTYMDLSLYQTGKFNRTLVAGTPDDAPFEYNVSGPGQGWNAGFLWKLTDKGTVGAYYRSEIRNHMQGEMSTHNLTGNLATVFGTGGGNVTSADTDISSPSNATIGYKYQLNEKTDLEFDIGWTGWSSNDTLETDFGTSNAVLVGFEEIHRDWHDTWSFHLGGSHVLNEDMTLSAGYFYMQRAVGNGTYTNEAPDGNRNGFNIGFAKKWNNWVIDFGYSAVIIGEIRVENIKGNTNNTDIDGTYKGFAQAITTGVRRAF
ncbi:MAG: long-chain fatty acid transport protein [Candidatus Omnitrophota bacterium]|jgi:long-chain fatty acid transport protein